MPGLPSDKGLGFDELQRPARVRILLRRPGRLVRPYLAGGLACLDGVLLRRGVALLGRSHQRGIDDLTTHGEITAFLELPVEVCEHRVKRTRLGQLLAEQADRVGIGRGRAKVKTEEVQPAQPVPDQILHRARCSAPPAPEP